MHEIRIARDLARRLHAGQTDKAGKDYFKAHLEPVASYVPAHLKPAAYLHDTLEDTPATPTTLREAGISEKTIGLVLALTRREGEPYADFIARIKVNEDPDAIIVKLADIKSNSDPTREGGTPSLRARYAAAKAFLLS